MFRYFLTLSVFLFVISASSIANADLVFTITEGTDADGNSFVRTTVSGSINTAATLGLNDPSTSTANTAFINPLGGLIGVGASGTSSLYDVDVAGFAVFGGVGSTTTGSGSGDRVALFSEPVLGLPEDYVSGTELNGTAEFSGATFESFLLTPGTFETVISNNGVSDTIRVVVVPEPSSILFCFGGFGVLASRRRRRRY